MRRDIKSKKSKLFRRKISYNWFNLLFDTQGVVDVYILLVKFRFNFILFAENLWYGLDFLVGI